MTPNGKDYRSILVEALKFYADRESYVRNIFGRRNPEAAVSQVEVDRGKLARAALAEIGEDA